MNYSRPLICLFFIVSFSIGFAQTVRIADNNFNAPTGTDVYSTIQEAVDAADPGDYIYIQPSPTRYGSVYLDKELHLVGIGFNLNKDSPLPSDMLDIILRNNIDNTSNASNSTVTGLNIRDIYFITYPGAPSFTLSDVSIFNCLIEEIQFSCCASTYIPVDNLELAGNRFTQVIDFTQAATNVIFRNNLFQSQVNFGSTNPNSGVVSNNIFYGTIYKASVGDNLIIQNNNFVGATGSSAAFLTAMRDAIVVNNIFYGRTPSLANGGASTSTSFQRNTFTNNLSFSTGNDELPPSGGGAGNTGDGNLQATSPSFTPPGVSLLNTWSSTYDFTLDVTSMAVNAGSDGTDIGITGGPYPFPDPNLVLKTTAIPTIQIFNTSTVINPGDDLDVRVKAKAN